MIDVEHFTPFRSLTGGLLLGFASAMLIGINGRLLGVSSILGHLLKPRSGDVGWRVTFLLGMFAAPVTSLWWSPDWVNTPRIDASATTIAVAGLLVGFGARCGSGCTSGHGVCGLSRLSLRSLVATLTFMAVGFVVVYLTRHFI